MNLGRYQPFCNFPFDFGVDIRTTDKTVQKEMLNGAWFNIVRSKNTFLGSLCDCSQLVIDYDYYNLDRSKAVFMCGSTPS